ncbi:hypothetical protein GUITHDRAFT_132415 [Guillardia theta CCMP2712]|uniref:Uncharacterized protein n=1 Tax=Guillardia theta (strain CCMP2712) TaxID=905079 RepID=L1JZH0_GUITC|nr:hypothetical protein GUITHDRAFT_132415 [Guillardia theta CCMP2712]EKX53986.1 hypothetical protein GUITHDRAFT_132415 [Guillardia theta CCMP2712]|eukprot:XP_005840966.1 hypothetical protein GUITHDRAFT_132415 [Guillardia theta CCMP2712]
MKPWLIAGMLVVAAAMLGTMWSLRESGVKFEHAMSELLAVRRALQTEKIRKWADMRGMRWVEDASKFVENIGEPEYGSGSSEDVCDLNKDISSPERARKWRNFWSAKYGTAHNTFIDWSGTLKTKVPEPKWVTTLRRTQDKICRWRKL